MAYYIKPPRGYLSLAHLEALTWQRYRFLLSVLASGGSVVKLKDLVEEVSTVVTSDGLIEGSQKDAVSHFMLRLACCQDPEMEKFLVKAETRLFSYRFSCMTLPELLSCIKPLKRFHKQASLSNRDCPDIQDIIHLVSYLTVSQDWTSLLRSYVESDGNSFVSIPFHYVLDLVRKRLVLLSDGVARVPCSKLCVVMTEIFSMILRRGMALAKQVLPSVVEEDLRIKKLLKSLKVDFGRHYHPFAGLSKLAPIACEDVEGLTDMFPLCMAHLHRRLRDKHRLRHFSRIQYTLFLKELGLPVPEALHFWRKEYSQPPACGKHGCQHTWDKDGKRYTYSIRHLYGLEGARVNYRAHCCTSIQDHSLAVGEDGGCPFKHFDRQHLLRELSLSGLSPVDMDDITDLAKERHSYNDACDLYLKAKLSAYQSTAVMSNTCSKYTTKSCHGTKESGYDTGSDLEPNSVRPPIKSLQELTDFGLSGVLYVEPTETSVNCYKDAKSKYCVIDIDHKMKRTTELYSSIQDRKAESETGNTHIDSVDYPGVKSVGQNSCHLKISCNNLVTSCASGVRNQQKSGEIDSGVNLLPRKNCGSCFDHKECPPSQHGSKHAISCYRTKTTTKGATMNIYKPIDYFATFKVLLDGLK